MRKLLYIALLALLVPSSEKITDLYLPNGLKLILKESHLIPKVGLSIFYNVGSHDDPEDQKGMAGLQRYLMDRAGDYTDRNDRLEEITYNIDIKHSQDLIYFSYDLNPKNLSELLAIEAHRLSTIDISQISLGMAKERMILDGMEYYSSKRRQHSPYNDGHPYALSSWGDTLQIQSITIDDALSFRHSYINPNSLTIVIVGDFDSSEIVKHIYNEFGGIQNNGRVQNDPDFSNDNSRKAHTKFQDSRDSLEGLDNAFVQVVQADVILPSFRNEDMLTMRHIANLMRYDSALDFYYSKKYLNKLGFLSLTFTEEKLGPSLFRFININMFKKKSYKKIKKNLSNMFNDLAGRGFDEDLLNTYRKRELLKLYKSSANCFSCVSFSIGKSELILGDYNNYDMEARQLEKLNNAEIKRVASQYLANQSIHTFEAVSGKWKILTPVWSFLINGIILNIPIMRSQMKKGNLQGFEGS